MASGTGPPLEWERRSPGVPSAHELDFGIAGFFSIEYGEAAARLLDVELVLLGNEAIQDGRCGRRRVVSVLQDLPDAATDKVKQHRF